MVARLFSVFFSFPFYLQLPPFRSSQFCMPGPGFSVNSSLADDNATYKWFARCEAAGHTITAVESFQPRRAVSCDIYNIPILWVKNPRGETCQGHLAGKWKLWPKGRRIVWVQGTCPFPQGSISVFHFDFYSSLC